MSIKQVITGAVLCLVASMSWGAMFPVAHIAMQHIDPFYFSLIRYLGVAVILSVILLIKEGRSAFKLEGRGLLLTVLGAMAFTVYNMCIFWGQSMMGEAGAIAASISEVLMPMLSVIIMWLITRKAPKRYTLFSIALALIGALLVITRGELNFFLTAREHVLPLGLMLVAVTGWVIYSMGGSRFKQWSVLRYSTLTCIMGSLVSMAIVGSATAAGALSAPSLDTLWQIKYEMAFMIVLPGLAALLSWNLGMKLLTPVNGVLFINAVPVTTFVIMAFQGYHIGSFELYGTALIIFALVHNNMQQRKSAATTAGKRRFGAHAAKV